MMEEISDQIFEDFLEEPKNEERWHSSPKYNQLLKKSTTYTSSPAKTKPASATRKPSATAAG